ncbi:MAG: transposase [candidate division KSB1 bacterium]|nr:transposase [candidate division KSB1 bacterium]
MKRHTPYHLYIDDYPYFINVHTYLNIYQMTSDFEKQKLLQKITEFFKTFHFVLYAWIILDNHYHLLFKTRIGRDLSKVFGKIHAGYSYEINSLQNCRGRKIWQNYWDWCIRSERDFWTHFNYLHHNCIKHGYCKKMEDYKFSSYRSWIKQKGEDWMMSVFQQYPIIDFSIDHDDFENDFE